MKAIMRDKAELSNYEYSWMGSLPISWNKPSLLYVLRAKISDGPHETPEYVENGIPFISIDSLNETKNISLKDCKRYITEEDYIRFSHKTRIEKDDILFSKAATIGKTAIIKDEKIMVWSPLAIIKANQNIINNEYLYHVLNCDKLIMDVSLSGSMNTQINVGMRELEHVKIPLPPFEEQQIIANYLDDRCSKIDAIIAEAKASIEEYKDLKQAVIYEAVTRGLDKNAPMKDSGVPAISKINSGFQIGKIGELQSGLTDGTHGTYARHSSGQLLLSSKNVQQEGLVIGNNESYISEEDYQAVVANGFPMKNDILLCCIGASIGRCILYEYDYPIAFQRSVIFIRTNKWMLPKFMLYSLQSPSTYMQENVIINQSAQAGLYQGLVKQIYVVVPPIEEQANIVDYLDNITSKIDALISEKQSLIEDLESYKKSLIYEVVTGKRKVVE